jgi:hypothetical protein
MTMASAWQQVTLLSSLPALPHFTRAKALPISAERLRARLGILAKDDAETLNRAWEFVRWRRGASTVTDAQLVERFVRLGDSPGERLVRDCVRPRLEVATVLAALRGRRDGETAAPAVPWGIGDLVVTISRRWSHPDFGLAHGMPWLPKARALLEQDDYLALERLVSEVAWQQLEGIDRGSAYALQNVIAYLLKWDILDRWLSMDPAHAATRFDSLLEQVLHDELAAVA